MGKLRFAVLVCLCCMACSCTDNGESVEFTVLQWNIWQEGTMVPGGYDAIVDEIARLQPDFVTFSEVRNYDGSTWEEIPVPSSVAEILSVNDASQRDDAIKCFIADAQQEIDEGAVVILGGDFNEPSHLDWIRETKDMYDHNGFIVPWTVTLMLDNAGFKDAYREMNPSVTDCPGFTFPADNPLVPVERLTWTPGADERERIDYVFYYPGKGLDLTNVAVFGPNGSICKSQRVTEASDDRFIEPLGVWPSDHKGLVARFSMSLPRF